MTTLRTWQAVAVAVVLVLTGCGSADDTPAQNTSAQAGEASDTPASATPSGSASARPGDQPTTGATSRPHADVCPTAFIGFTIDKSGKQGITSSDEQLAFGGFDIIPETPRRGMAIRLTTELSNEAIYVLGIAVTNAQGELTLRPYDAQVAVEEPKGTKEVVFLLHNRQYSTSLDFPKKYRQLYRNC